MRRHTVAAFAALIMSVTACGAGSDYGSGPTPGITFPAVTRPAAIYRNYSGTARYVVYDSGGDFGLQYGGSAEYKGTYSRVGDVITFVFADNPTQGWNAKGTITGNSMFVQYSEDMALSDFIDEVFIRQ